MNGNFVQESLNYDQEGNQRVYVTTVGMNVVVRPCLIKRETETNSVPGTGERKPKFGWSLE